MQEGSFIWGHLGKQHRTVDRLIDGVWLIFLLLAAVLLFSVNLGGVALRDGDEGIVAQVAREIFRAPAGSMAWLYPTLGGEPYPYKPPLMHLLVAWVYHLKGVNEWSTRIPGAILTACSVPLLYCIGREIFRQRWVAIYSALIYLTMLPVVRHGRLAILDGAVVSFLMVMMLCVLRSRRDLRYCLGIGIGLGLICLTQGIFGLLLGAIAVVFLLWDTPRLLTCYYLWIAIGIGILPAFCWYGAQLLHYGHTFLKMAFINPTINQIGIGLKDNFQLSWFHFQEIALCAWPWLLFVPQSLRLTWENRNLSWAKLVLVWIGVYLVIILGMGSKLHWYLLPIYPGLALALGAQITETENLPLLTSYPRSWIAGLSLMALAGSAGSIFFSAGATPKTDLQVISAAVALTMTLAAIYAERGDGQFLKILFWGTYISLLLLMKTNYWVWELGNAYPVKPVASMILQANPSVKQIYTSFPYSRPSLDFYSDRKITPATLGELEYYWHYKGQSYFLINESAYKSLRLNSVKIIGQAEGWKLITRDSKRL
ncbi:glycosyltransferase family 39 protein [Tolypothrix sp. FACHB-123]|uniref:ArnT family glycosyltransferase n=1 Tax=Tolypothrix sp. FACHB-123 TaxID=2692868 RepID=UPI00168382B0|nr:glycosyltransferase family 39 protein [Tolypothrix sp. FACHB-123]MBD2356838.1 glycosyltransferase family 39 protein [Tolypothrix sp. FACHB-123]